VRFHVSNYCLEGPLFKSVKRENANKFFFTQMRSSFFSIPFLLLVFAGFFFLMKCQYNHIEMQRRVILFLVHLVTNIRN
jgi:hypothetical protein